MGTPLRRLPLVLLLALIPVCALAADLASLCPKLPAASELHWQPQQGPDFLVCYAYPDGDTKPSRMIGVYLGMAPSFDPNKAQKLRAGKFGKTAVEWYRMHDDHFAYSAQTLYPQKFGVAHIWVMTGNQQGLDKLILIAEQMHFDP